MTITLTTIHLFLEASVTVTSVLGMLTSLPCNITPSLPDDRYKLHMNSVHMYDIYCNHKGGISQEVLFSLAWIAQGLDVWIRAWLVSLNAKSCINVCHVSVLNFALLYVGGFLTTCCCFYFLYIFCRARVCWPLLLSMIFERCLDSNPECCHSKWARYQLSHASP